MPGKSKLTSLGWLLSKPAPDPRIASMSNSTADLTAGTKRELPLSNPMRQLDSAERDRCISIRLEACHLGASALADEASDHALQAMPFSIPGCKGRVNSMVAP